MKVINRTTMEVFTITIYCFVDNYLKNGHPKESSSYKLTGAQIITTALEKVRYFVFCELIVFKSMFKAFE